MMPISRKKLELQATCIQLTPTMLQELDKQVEREGAISRVEIIRKACAKYLRDSGHQQEAA